MGSKLLRGSFLIMIGNVIFRVGGYVYRFLMASLLGPSSYGILGLTLPFQGIFQTLSSGGMPPAIAKYIAEYEVLGEKDLARQTIYTSLKITVILGLFFGFFMVFYAAPWIAEVYLQKPEATIPLQIVGLIAPFSSIVGAFRGAFQGVYKMEYILYTRFVEQIGMILFATAFVLIGLSVTGALVGTTLGFVFSTILAIYIFKNYMGEFIPSKSPDFKFSIRDELKLTKQLLFFSVPVIITALAEMGIYTICTLVMGRFLTSAFIGYYAAADPIARLPLIISISISTTILPASSEAFSSKNKQKLTNYVNEAYKYSMLFIVPMCVGIALFAKEILSVVYFTNPAYMIGADALAILTIGMTFYSIYVISTSIIQGIGNPRIPMYILIVGCIITLVLSVWLVPIYGIVGGAFANTFACVLMMFPILYFVFKLTKTKAPVKSIGKIILSSLIMGIVIILLPSNSIGLLLGIILCPIVYFLSITGLRFFTLDDINNFRKYSLKLGPLANLFDKILNFMEKFIISNQ
ncbi:oligosaccharide flippase family protein [Methanobrevibacter sp. DSM 116169]|uniref:oligosaccharide flippase family protein n=1 Tax=Methanobrevibacter sp. DSM 116169 TaxID=3242727 RepID=UPI0038FC2D04